MKWGQLTGDSGSFLSIVITSEGHIFASGNFQNTNGVHLSIDTGKSWLTVNEGFAASSDSVVNCLGVGTDGHLFAGTFSGKIYRSTQPVADACDVSQPSEPFYLSQNYPNPFNPSTTITYELPQRSHVTLAVFNMLGQKVRTLVDEMVDAGYQSVEFDASGLASGVYLYRLQAGSFVQTRRMLILK